MKRIVTSLLLAGCLVVGCSKTNTSSQDDPPTPKIQIPSVSTSSVESVTKNSASCGGDVTSDGGADVTARGVVWGTSQNPTLESCAGKTSDGSGKGTFTSSLTNLTAATTYYVRSYATNSAGVGYGEQKSFTTKEPEKAPTVTTASVTSVTNKSASCGGDVTSDGGADVTARGVVWGTSQNPTLESCAGKTSDGSGKGTFTSSLTNLTAATTYYVRSYATNSVGTSYGEQKSFTTAAQETKPTVTTVSVSSITNKSAACGGNVTSDGGADVTVRGVVWGTYQNPTVESCAGKTEDGGGTGEFSSSLTSLTAATTYYVRSYATNSVGTSYGEQRSFTTAAQETKPTVTTASVTSVTKNSASCGGNVTSDGGADVTVRGVVWGTYQNPTVESCAGKTEDGGGTGEFSSSLSSLTASTTYYVRSYATNSVGTSYGEQRSFTTAAQETKPTVTTASVTSVTKNSASCGGNVTSDGGADVTVRGVVWGTYQNPTVESCAGKTEDGGGTGEFSSSLSGLTASTTYYVRSYATNSVGTSYGEQKSFTTAAQETKPNVTTASVSSVTDNSATCGGSVTSDGGASVTVRGVVWSTSQNPTVESCTGKTKDGSETGVFTSSLTGLNASTTYYVRSYATNSAGTAYGVQKSFTTKTKTSGGGEDIGNKEYEW